MLEKDGALRLGPHILMVNWQLIDATPRWSDVIGKNTRLKNWLSHDA